MPHGRFVLPSCLAGVHEAVLLERDSSFYCACVSYTSIADAKADSDCNLLKIRSICLLDPVQGP